MINLIDIQFVQITAEYSNAVLLAVMPYVSDFAGKMELPVTLPVTVQQVQAFACDRRLGDPGGALRLTNGYIFEFWHGHVNEFKTKDRYSDLQDPRLVPKFYGELRMTEAEAVALCRAAIGKLGYTDEMLYADLPPRIENPPSVGTNVIPRYVIEWVDPRDGRRSCQFEVNGQEKKIEKVYFMNRNLWRTPPPLDVEVHARQPSLFQKVNPEYARRLLLSAVLPEITDYAHKLKLPLSLPVTTNQVAAYTCQKHQGDLYADVILASGHRFFYRHGMIQCFDAPDCFFDPTKPGVRVKDFIGAWKMTESEAVNLAKATLRKLGYSDEVLFLDQNPEITKPHNVSDVPRLRIEWLKGQRGVQLSSIIMEIDCEHEMVKSLYLFHYKLSRPLPDLGVSPEVEVQP